MKKEKKLVCIDLGGTSIKAGVCGADGALSERCLLPVHQQFDALRREIAGFAGKMKEIYCVEGLAVSAPGTVDKKTGVIGGGSAIPCIHGPAWIQVLKGDTGLKVSIENDANCAALAELFFGNARGYSDMAFVICGTGIGGAVVMDKRIRSGAHLYGGEFGCMVMRDEEGRLSTFSAQASTMSFVRKMEKLRPKENWDGKKVFTRAEQGDTDCLHAIDVFYRNLAEGIYNIQHVFDPEIILLGGGISSRSGFTEEIRKRLKGISEEVDERFATRTVTPLIDTCAFKDGANLIGAAADWMQRYQR